MLMLQPPRVRVPPRARLLQRHPGLQLQGRRRPSGASPSSDSRRSGPPPPLTVGPAHVTTGSTPPPANPGPGGRAAPVASGPPGLQRRSRLGEAERLAAGGVADRADLAAESGSLLDFYFLVTAGVAAVTKGKTRALRKPGPLPPVSPGLRAVWLLPAGLGA